MSDNIYDNRFYSHREPAWHRKGITTAAAKTALEALDMIGDIKVRLEKLPVGMYNEDNKRQFYNSGYSMIVREKLENDPMERRFGAPVRDGYELVSPRDAAQIWTDTVKSVDGTPLPVESMFFLGFGQKLVITSEIEKFHVNGDEMRMFIGMYNPMYSNHAAKIFSTAVRVVCQNTLTLGLREATATAIIPHLPGCKEQIKEWISTIYRQQSGIVVTAKVDFEKMAATPMRSKAFAEFLENLYPLPQAPNPANVGRFNNVTTFERMEELYEQKTKGVIKARDAVTALFAGEGTGMDTDACRDTAYGALNAHNEYNDCRRSATGETAIEHILVGDRFQKNAQAYRLIKSYCTTGSWTN